LANKKNQEFEFLRARHLLIYYLSDST
jgi:hypothetical protein